MAHDELDFAPGQVKLKRGGSHGGHKGLLSIINSLGTLDFPRLRLGVKPDGQEIDDWVNFVLQHMHPDDRAILEVAEQEAADAVEMIADKDFPTAMNSFNRKKGEEA